MMSDEEKIETEVEEDTKEESQENTETSESQLTSASDNTEEEEKQWYVVNTYTGRERAVANSLEQRRDSLELNKGKIYRIIVAEYQEPVLGKDGKQLIDKKTGKPKFKTKNYYPGYIFIEMNMSDEAWYIVRNTPDVTGFVGSSGKGTKPFPVPKAEIEPVLKKLKIADEDMFTDYKVGDIVKILTGPFEDSEGQIASVNPENQEVSVTITFFGRPTSITVNFSEIEKA